MPLLECHSRNSVGILAYGSLIADPGVEIGPLVDRRIEVLTPFPVEFARLSASRGGAPTVVPHSSGRCVKAQVMVLKGAVSLVDARDLLWRRETRNELSGRRYVARETANAVLVRELRECCGLALVLYTDFNPGGKIADPEPASLADAAIRSVRIAAPGKDGVSYLIDLLAAGIDTALTSQYVAEILARTGERDLHSALSHLRTTVKGRPSYGQS